MQAPCLHVLCPSRYSSSAAAAPSQREAKEICFALNFSPFVRWFSRLHRQTHIGASSPNLMIMKRPLKVGQSEGLCAWMGCILEVAAHNLFYP